MTKKKLITFISLAFAVIMIITSVMLFYAYMPSVDYQLSTLRVSNLLDDYIESYEKRYESETELTDNFDELFFSISKLDSPDFLPIMYALIDPETGEVVAKSTSYITFTEDYEHKSKYLNIEPYLTPEIKKQISDYQKSIKQGVFYIYRMSFNTSSGEYIPVEMELGFYDKYEPCVVKFTDYKADLEIVENTEFGLFNYVFYDLDESAFNHRHYEWMNEFLNERIAEVKAGDYSNSGGGYSGNDKKYFVGIDFIGEKKYVSVFVSTHNEYYDTLKHTSFLESLLLITILFAFVYVFVIVAASKLYDKNQKLNQSLRAFTSAAAHELKTPLAVIQNQCECIIENVAPEKNEDYIKSVYDEAVRMNGIVGSFLQYNRLVNADKLQKEKCSLREIVLTEIEKYKSFAEMQGVEFNFEICDNDVIVNCNRDLVSMAVDNYLSNAIKYATGDKKVTVKLEKDRFSVYNTSEGISRETADSMWDILSRDNKARTKDGSSTGMGLPICAEIFKAHGFEYGYRKLQGKVEFYFEFK